MKRLGSGLFGRPKAIFLDEVIGKDDELSHDGGQGERFLDLSSSQEALVKALEMLVEARRRKGCHIDTVAHGLAAAPRCGAGRCADRCRRRRGRAPPTSGLLGAKTAKLGHVGNQPASCHGSHAWNGDEDSEPAREGRIAFDGLNGQFFKHVSRGFSAFDLTLDLALDACGTAAVASWFPSAVPAAKAASRFRTISRRFSMVSGSGGVAASWAITPNAASIRASTEFGFRQRAKQLGEEPGAQRIDDGDGKPGIVQKAVDAAMVFACRFDNHDPHFEQLRAHRSCL